MSKRVSATYGQKMFIENNKVVHEPSSEIRISMWWYGIHNEIVPPEFIKDSTIDIPRFVKWFEEKRVNDRAT
jgi:hypothetical protein